MGYWDNLEEVAELEEGEAACGNVDDDTIIDPDVDLSYIDDKIQNVLGHFQKEFEGVVFTQNLGAKYGDYGSFLPMYRRSPPNLSHPSPRVQNQSTSRSSCNLAEGGSQNLVAASNRSVIQTSVATVANSMHGPHSFKSLPGEDSERHDSSQIAEKAPERDEPSENPPDQRKLTVRIKVVPDKGLHRNAAIYSGLGLSSPSSSMGNSPEEVHGAQLSSQETFNESTTNIIKTLTSCSVSCDSLHSPLHDDLLNLIRSRKESVDRKPAAFLKERSGSIVLSDDNEESVQGVKGLLAGKKSKSVQINENDLQARLGNEVHSVDWKKESETQNSMPCFPQLPVGTDRSFGSVGKAPEVVRQLEQHMPVKKRGLKDKAKERISGCEFVKDETLKTMDAQDTAKHQECRSNSVESSGKRGLKVFDKECLFAQGEDVTVKGSHTRAKSVKLAANRSTSKELSAGGKNKLKWSQINGNSMLESDGTLTPEINAAVKDRKSVSRAAKKVHHSHKDLLDTHLEHMDDQSNPPEKHLVHISKNLHHEDISVKGDDEAKIGQKHGSRKSGNKSEPVLSQGGSLADNVPPSNGLMSRTEPAPGTSSVVITEDWVECVHCQTWRLLPPGISAAQLPDKWMCSMQHWLPGMNRCDFSEDETAQALRALYHPPIPETQNTLLTDANAHQAQLNAATQHQMSLGKKFQSVDTSHTSNISRPLVNSHLMKNNQQDSIKGITPRSTNQPSSEVNLVRKSDVKLLQKTVKVTEKCSDSLEENGLEKPRKKIKRETNSDDYEQRATIKVKTEGHEKTKKKFKRERNSDYDDQGVAKRVKIEGHIGNLYPSEDDEKPGKTQVSSSASLPKKVGPKGKQKQLDNKDKVKLQISVKRRKDSLSDSVDSGSLDVKTNKTTRLSTKSRKIEKSGDQFQDTTISVQENSGDSELRSGKKFKASESEVKGFSKTGAGDKSKIGNTQSRMPGSRTNSVDKNAKKAQQFKAKLPSGLTMEDLTALRRDLGSEQFSTAATSSSSKVSDSGRSRTKYQEAKGSPVESVSSSPMRPSNLRKFSPTRMCGLGKDEMRFGEFPAERNRKRLSYIDDAFESNQSGTSMKEIVGNQSFEVPVPEIQGADTKGKDKTALSVRAARRVVSTEAQTSKRSSPSHVDVKGVTHLTSKIRVNNNPDPSQRHKSGVDPSARSKEINKASESNFEQVSDRVSVLPRDHEALQWNQSVRDETRIDPDNRASCHELVDNSNNPFSDESTIKSLTNDKNVSKRNSRTGIDPERWGDIKCQTQPKFRECDQSQGRMNGSAETSVEIIPTDVGSRSGKLKVCSNTNDNGLPFYGSKSTAEIQKGDPLDLRPLSTSKGSEGLHILEAVPNSAFKSSDRGSMKHPGSDQCGDQNSNGHSHSKEDTTIQSASAALAKAEEYKHFGDFSKESGFECKEAYFKAALMYLLGASLLESSNTENQKVEMNQIQMSGSSAKLCETCALEYEKRQEMAAAALAYKCMEVSYMRIVYFKSLCTRRVWHDVQASLQMISKSESPSSSASDIDNSNYQIINDKPVLCKANGSTIGSHTIPPQDHQNFIQLLDFTKDVNSAMEAVRKSQSAFAAAAKMMAGQAHDNIISSVKEVIDFGFQDLEVFVRMVQHAIGAISRLGFGGG
ncbi:hypothetical protein Leryth_014062 [Lithospermum erythrorhizon]|nr:hypothetical protein Leryth_014062 [Lithospermum erythrorhizon]